MGANDPAGLSGEEAILTGSANRNAQDGCTVEQPGASPTLHWRHFFWFIPSKFPKSRVT